MTRSRGRQTRMWLVQVVHIADPHVTSAANLVLLQKQYFALDKSIYSDWRMAHIRRKWMKKQMKSPDAKGGLTCAICGKQGLNPTSEIHQEQATLDHITNISDGGSWSDSNNFQVACHRCNSDKNKTLRIK